MDEPPALQRNRHWRMAVWALRVGFVGLALAIVGVVVLATGSTPWVLAVGVIIWLAAAVVTLTGVFWARGELAEPRPGLWPMRFMLLRDTVHPLPRCHVRDDAASGGADPGGGQETTSTSTSTVPPYATRA